MYEYHLETTSLVAFLLPFWLVSCSHIGNRIPPRRRNRSRFGTGKLASLGIARTHITAILAEFYAAFITVWDRRAFFFRAACADEIFWAYVFPTLLKEEEPVTFLTELLQAHRTQKYLRTLFCFIFTNEMQRLFSQTRNIMTSWEQLSQSNSL